MPGKKTPEQHISDFRKVHGNKYTYHPETIVRALVKMKITCPEHGDFWQTPANHKTGHRCPECGAIAKAAARAKTPDQWVDDFRKNHGDKYTYHPETMGSAGNKMKITCPEHGDFWQKQNSHMAGRGCPKCWHQRLGERAKKSASQHVDDCVKAHQGKYDYYLADGVRADDEIPVVCPEHGVFKQRMADHKLGSGCPKCAGNGTSKAEDQIAAFVEGLGFKVRRRDRGILEGKEIDILVDDANLGIEYCGTYWHSSATGTPASYHVEKLEKCSEEGIRLLTVFEDEWRLFPHKVESTIRVALGVRERGLGARQMTVEIIDGRMAADFLDKHHLQGSSTGGVSYALLDGGSISAVMTFGRPTRQSSHRWELKRFATDGRTHAGAASRLFQAFVRDQSPESVVSFSDRRWFDGGMYGALGFSHDGLVRPDYSYVKGWRRYHKSKFRRAGIKRHHPEVYSENLSESEMMSLAGYYKIFDCGKDRWVWTQQPT